MIKIRIHLFMLLIVVCSLSNARSQNADFLFIITLDGLRWQELFSGADARLIGNLEYVDDTMALKDAFWHDELEQRRERLLPFFWSTIAHEGQLFGDREAGNKMNCSNIFWFSYPGYAELLCGQTNANAINSNAKVPNPDTTFLERLHNLPEFKGKVAAFGSWDVFPFIINEKRSGIPVNAGFQSARHALLTDREQFLNSLQQEIPSPWGSVRLDAFTHHYAMEYVRTYTPRVVYIAYGETDDFAHDSDYTHYLKSAHQTDAWIAAWWKFIQSHPIYKDRTSLLITTDHGRGADDGWTSHGKTYIGSDAIWMAAMGAGVAPAGVQKQSQQLWQQQVAGTALTLLGYPHLIGPEMGKPVDLTIR